MNWQCGCGHINGPNLTNCAYCNRTPAEGGAVSTKVPADERLDRTLFDLIMRSKSPCGHWGSHAYSPDGKGKHILCLDCENARLQLTVPPDDLLDRLEEYLDDHSDVIDGDGGPIANTAIRLLDDLQRWRKKR